MQHKWHVFRQHYQIWYRVWLVENGKKTGSYNLAVLDFDVPLERGLRKTAQEVWDKAKRELSLQDSDYESLHKVKTQAVEEDWRPH